MDSYMRGCMTNQKKFFGFSKTETISTELSDFFNETRNALKGHGRRLFMARVVKLLGHGGQRKAQKELGWNRDVIRKGLRELESGIRCDDNFSARGRLPAEKHLPNLLVDMRDIVEPLSQADPTFKTTNEYSPITAPEVRRRLIDDKQYSDEELPCVRTIQKKMNELNFRIQKVQKCKPKKNSGDR